MMDKPTMDELRAAFRGTLERSRRKATKKCVRCGKKLVETAKTRPRKYCADCKHEVILESQRRSYQRQKALRKANPPKKKEEPKKRPQALFEAAIRAAKEAGMSYGMYVALKGAGRI